MSYSSYQKFMQLTSPKKKKRITEDSPGWNPKTMGNKRGSMKIAEDDPRWNAVTMGNKKFGADYKLSSQELEDLKKRRKRFGFNG